MLCKTSCQKGKARGGFVGTNGTKCHVLSQNHCELFGTFTQAMAERCAVMPGRGVKDFFCETCPNKVPPTLAGSNDESRRLRRSQSLGGSGSCWTRRVRLEPCNRDDAAALFPVCLIAFVRDCLDRSCLSHHHR